MGYQDDGSRFGGEPRNLPYIEHARYRIPRRRTRQKRTGLKKALSGLSVMSGLMAMLAAFNVLEGSGFQHNLKCVLIGAAMMLVALTVNSAAIHEGATQAALGLWSGWVLFSLMIFTGCGL